MSRQELRREFAFAADRPVTLAVGRLVPVKGYDRLIDLWDDGLGQLLIVGDGPLRATLERRAVGKPVAFAGFRNDARAMMAGADLMAFASEREGFSYALAEALLARLPVVSTRVPGAANVLPASHVVAASQLKTAIGACLADLAAAKMRMAGVFEWAAATLTVQQMVARTRQVYAATLR
jgi:glycosyltransferase involved in cell wall biosynthesis